MIVSEYPRGSEDVGALSSMWMIVNHINDMIYFAYDDGDSDDK